MFISTRELNKYWFSRKFTFAFTLLENSFSFKHALEGSTRCKFRARYSCSERFLKVCMFMSEITIEGLLTFEIHSDDPRLRLALIPRGGQDDSLTWHNTLHKRKQGCRLSSIYERTLYPESLLFPSSCRWFTPRCERIFTDQQTPISPCNFSNLDVGTALVNYDTYAMLRLLLKDTE